MHDLAVIIGPTFWPLVGVSFIGLMLVIGAARTLLPAGLILPFIARLRCMVRGREEGEAPAVVVGAWPLAGRRLSRVRSVVRLAEWCPAAAVSLGLIGTLLGFSGALPLLGRGEPLRAVEPLTQAIASTLVGQVVALVLSLGMSLVLFLADGAEVRTIRQSPEPDQAEDRPPRTRVPPRPSAHAYDLSYREPAPGPMDGDLQPYEYPSDIQALADAPDDAQDGERHVEDGRR